MTRSLLLCVLISSATLAQAQQAATSRAPAAATAPRPAVTPAQQAPALTPAQQAQLAKQNADMTQMALQVAQMVDGGHIGALWDGASAVAKRAVQRDAFVKQIAGERARLGAVGQRGSASVSRVQYGPGAQVPEGLYVNVSFPTRFASAPQPVRELISFRMDEDRTWRVSGYSLRAPR